MKVCLLFSTQHGLIMIFLVGLKQTDPFEIGLMN